VKVSKLVVRGFRAFAEEVEFDLDADVVLVVGANGRGKTSLFDALLWLLSGGVPRLGEAASVVSMYSADGEARVEGRFHQVGNEDVRVVRTTSGTQQGIMLEKGGKTYRGDEAEMQILKTFWPDALVAPDSASAFTAALRRSIYLEQDRVREFVDADDDQERFNAISELVGAGRVTELQRDLERARKAWTTATNRLDKDRAELEQRLKISLDRLDQLGTDAVDPETANRWQDWWNRASDLGIVEQDSPVPATRDAGPALDRAIAQANVHRLSLRRDHAEVTEFIEALVSHDEESAVAETAELKTAAARRREEADQLRADLARATELQTELRREQLEVRDAAHELGVLAELALRHLGERCPVCQQEYDKEETTQRLSRLVEVAGASAPESPEGAPDTDTVKRLIAELARHQQLLSKSELELAQAESESRVWRAWKSERIEQLARLDIAPTTDESELQERLDYRSVKLSQAIEEVTVLASEGEALALELTRISEGARRADIDTDVARLRLEVSELDDRCEARGRTRDLATLMIEGLREAGSEVVERELKRIEPTLQRLYARIDPHVALRTVRFLTEYPRGRGRLRTSLFDDTADVGTDAPGTVLSSSQMNALAVCVFLSFNLGLASLPLEMAILDDPLQSLDDVNLLGLVDMLRRTKERRQLMLSTHDPRFAALLEKKLRPIEDGRRTVVISFEGWNRDGPRISTHQVPPDSKRLRIVA